MSQFDKSTWSTDELIEWISVMINESQSLRLSQPAEKDYDWESLPHYPRMFAMEELGMRKRENGNHERSLTDLLYHISTRHISTAQAVLVKNAEEELRFVADMWPRLRQREEAEKKAAEEQDELEMLEVERITPVKEITPENTPTVSMEEE
ncbi:hypothetical protein TREMEDRAFT_61792 [Tremella mesenterica DSM 1558]|uniref:uncharacterized protein n=1 Tax=Tremella mesenterica (strain ATCC 24925 / CBS 8224 / DSM 1558 / NBRC 9311 / NRRL Y-6157 / RJB 2259-6 / UBC 559-6) TaxID=578456 RepID=UPI0003F49F2B|nr:uncharacterized protein TREMEDRAFT_61792 [Tremella mesenterica DSM 1558]EIW70029.1 hypothetical protein TREMEDRAFT_61792 [Tremella mesenterica DSM 1558]